MHQLEIKIEDQTKAVGEQTLFTKQIGSSFRVGRQDGNETDQIDLIVSSSRQSEIDQKLVIASALERDYSRHFAEIILADGKVEVHNTSHQPIAVGGQPLEPKHRRVVQTPTTVKFVNRTLHLARNLVTQRDESIFSLPRSYAPASMSQYGTAEFRIDPNLNLVTSQAESQIDSRRLLELLQTMLQIFQDSPNSQQFFDRATMAMFHLLKLDHVLIAFHEDFRPVIGASAQSNKLYGKWCYQSRHNRPSTSARGWTPSNHIVQMVEEQKETVYQVPDIRTASLADVTCLVASPLLNSSNELVGFIYGDRQFAGAGATMFNEAEAKFVELFANGISVGLERLTQERKLSEMRSRFDQFFTPELARQLELDATLLKPRSAQVSVLFADIRGFSRISERIGPEETISWINSVMNELSDCVLEHEWVVVDYIGDEILAMWGAPLDRENHAELAVRAAVEMNKRLPRINQQWESVLGEPVEIGIGVNSGEAQVGNIGSDRKFKYGPLGDVVNVSSRVQSSTKQLGTFLLITESTARALPATVLCRKIRSVRFINVKRAVNVYEIPLCPDKHWIELKKAYEHGLKLYEQGELRAASQQMASVINRFPDDGPSVHLLSDSVSNLSRNREDFDPVWTLERK